MPVERLFSIMPDAHTDERRRRQRLNVDRVLVLNTPTPCSNRRAEEEAEIQCRLSACS